MTTLCCEAVPRVEPEHTVVASSWRALEAAQLEVAAEVSFFLVEVTATCFLGYDLRCELVDDDARSPWRIDTSSTCGGWALDWLTFTHRLIAACNPNREDMDGMVQ